MRSAKSFLSTLLLLPLALVVGGACGGTSGAVLSSADGGETSPTFPPGPVDCVKGPNFSGCTCQLGDSRACYTGPPETRGVGTCKDGVQICQTRGEVSAYAFGTCMGEIVPSASSSCAADGGGPDSSGNEEAGASCGGFAGLACPAGQYCDNFPANDACGGGDSGGQCKPRPVVGCTADCPGVCGCDNKTYCNACGANAAGVAVRHAGSC